MLEDTEPLHIYLHEHMSEYSLTRAGPGRDCIGHAEPHFKYTPYQQCVMRRVVDTYLNLPLIDVPSMLI